MTEYRDWSITASSNTGTAANGFFREGMAFSEVNNAAREFQAILARDRKDRNGTLVSTGSTSSYVLSPSATLTSLQDGDYFRFRAHVKNAGASTLQLASATARPIVKTNLSALSEGDIVAGGIYEVFYHSASGNFQIKNSAIEFGAVQSTVGSAGSASALPATPSGYLAVNISGVEYVIPYYAKS